MSLVEPQSPDLVNQSYINIYHLNEQYRPEYISTLDASSFGLKQLTIEDFAVDSSNRAYLVDSLGGLRTFQYLKSNRIVKGPSFGISGSNHYRVSTYSIAANKTAVLLGTDEGIIELEYYGKILTSMRKYELPADFEWEDSTDLTMNANYFSLKSNRVTYIY